MNFEKQLTDIPLLDEIVYNTKIMAYGTVLKDQEAADKAETSAEIQRIADMYIKCIDNTLLKFESFIYTYDFLVKTADRNGLSPSYFQIYADNNHLIPEDKRANLLELRRQLYIEEYEEYNEYYRKLNGLPPVNDKGIYIYSTHIEEKYINDKYNEYIKDLPEEVLTDAYKTKLMEKARAAATTKFVKRVLVDLPETLVIDTEKPIHLMSDTEVDNLYSLGIIDQLMKMYPKANYLKHLGYNKISIYDARTAPKFGILFIPACSVGTLYNDYKVKLEKNRMYTLRTIYSDAEKLMSDYYDNFIILFIVLQTMIDMIIGLPDYITRREVFDIRTVQYFLEGFGIEFYREIPLVYQIRMVKNLNKLIKFKSTTKNIVDICSLFGYDDIQIFKYYLLRCRKKNADGSFVIADKVVADDNTGERTLVEDLDQEYELKFLQCPIEKEHDDVIRDESNYHDYDHITGSDIYWDGGQDHEYVKSRIIQHEFNVLRSKYISIDTMQSMSQIASQICYFYNIIFDNKRLEEDLRVAVPYISGSRTFRFTDIICFLFSISHEYNNLKDNILRKREQIMYINGFNFNVDLATLGEYIKSQGFTMEELGIDSFEIPDTSILSYNQLLDLYTKNLKVRDHVIDQMYNANNKKIYDLYKKIYDALMIVEYTDEFFKLSDGTVAETYYDYLVSRDSTLAASIRAIRSVNDPGSRKELIGDYISEVIYSLEEFINGDKYRYLWMNIPTISGDAIKKYISKVINFFKSYKVDILNINTIYVFNDKFENLMRAIDNIEIIVEETKLDYVNIQDKISITENVTYQEHYRKPMIKDKIFIEINRLVDMLYKDRVDIHDQIHITETYLYEEKTNIHDKVTITPVYE